MQQLIHKLSNLSDNAGLFQHLRTSGVAALAAKANTLFRAEPQTRKADLLQALLTVLVSGLSASDVTGLDDLIEEADLNDRVTIVGELILALHALAEHQQSGEQIEVLVEPAFRLMLGLAADFEGEQPQDGDDAELLEHGIALREWAHLFSGFYQAAGINDYAAEMLMVRARVTNSTLSSWPQLVGGAMVDIAVALRHLGKAEMATKICNGVRMDLSYLADQIDNPAFPEVEKIAAVYWLQRATEEFLQLVPKDKAAQKALAALQKLRQERGHTDAPSTPRFGPIAKTYLEPTPFLARVLRELRNSQMESLAEFCHWSGCPSSTVEFYLSAMGSYDARSTILKGVRTMYDEAHMEVFAALDYLRTTEK